MNLLDVLVPADAVRARRADVMGALLVAKRAGDVRAIGAVEQLGAILLRAQARRAQARTLAGRSPNGARACLRAAASLEQAASVGVDALVDPRASASLGCACTLRRLAGVEAAAERAAGSPDSAFGGDPEAALVARFGASSGNGSGFFTAVGRFFTGAFQAIQKAASRVRKGVGGLFRGRGEGGRRKAAHPPRTSRVRAPRPSRASRVRAPSATREVRRSPRQDLMEAKRIRTVEARELAASRVVPVSPYVPLSPWVEGVAPTAPPTPILGPSAMSAAQMKAAARMYRAQAVASRAARRAGSPDLVAWLGASS